MVKVGLIGFGLAGQSFHAPLINGVEGMELSCILARSGNLAARLYPGTRIVRTLDDFLSDTSIEVCVIATPNDTHFELAKACLLADRAVVVDKPFAPTFRQCEELVLLAREHNRLLTVYHNRRWDGDFRALHRLIKQGALGRVVEFESRFDRFRPEFKGVWRERKEVPGAGVLFDLGPHLIDQALYLFGAPQTVTAKAFCQRESSEVDDSFDVCLEYPYLRAMLRARILAYAPGPHFLVHGTEGSFIKYGMDPQEPPLRSGNIPKGKDWGPDWGREPEETWGTLTQVDKAPRKVESDIGDYRGFYANVRDAIDKGTPFEVTLDQALHTMRALLLAHKSSREERTVGWDDQIE